MQMPRLSLCILLAFCFIGQPGCSRDPDQVARQALVTAWKSAHASGDTEAMLALFCWDGVEEADRAFIRQSVMADFDLPVESVQVVPLGKNADFAYDFEGKRYVPNLTPVAQLEVVFANAERMHVRHPLGSKDGQYLLINPRPQVSE